jgi:hypothetical protein
MKRLIDTMVNINTACYLVTRCTLLIYNIKPVDTTEAYKLWYALQIHFHFITWF